MIKTMTDEGFLEYDKARGCYSIGFKVYICGSVYSQSNTPMRLLQRAASSIVEACGETCQVGVRDGQQVRYLLRVDSPQPIRLVSHPGAALPVYSTAIGKALLSALTIDEVQALTPLPWERLTEHTLTSPEQLHAELDEVRMTGIAYDRCETTEGVSCIAVPLNVNGRAAYGLGVTAPSFRLDTAKEDEIRSILVQTKHDLEPLLA